MVNLTNQSAVGRRYFDMIRSEGIHDRVGELLAANDVEIGGNYICPHTPEDRCDCRKSLRGLLLRAPQELGFDPARALVIGDKPGNIELGRVVGATSILVRTGYGAEHEAARTVAPDYVADDLLKAVDYRRDAGLYSSRFA